MTDRVVWFRAADGVELGLGLDEVTALSRAIHQACLRLGAVNGGAGLPARVRLLGHLLEAARLAPVVSSTSATAGGALSTSETAKVLGLTVRGVRHLHERGRLPAVRGGGRGRGLRFEPSVVEAERVRRGGGR